MTTLQATEAVAKTTDVVEAMTNGNIEQVIQQLITLCVEAGKSILLAAVIYMVGKILINLANRLLCQMMERRRMDPTIQSFLKSFVSILLTTLLIVTVVSALGVNTTSFAALLASVGVAAGMALSGNLQNLAGGIVILLFKPFKVGDFIEAQGVTGYVKEIQIIHTIVLTNDNKRIFLPNGTLSSGVINNYSFMPTRRVDFTVAVEYGTDAQRVIDTVNEIIQEDTRILQDPAPFVALAALADSSVNFAVRVWVRNADYWDVFYAMNRRIYERFNEAGICFPFPQVQVHQDK